jgi:large subunit ribosomal protein L6
MSRIGKLPIEIPLETTAVVEKGLIKVTGSKGELSMTINQKIIVNISENKIILLKKVNDRESASLYGLTRTMIANMIKGVNEGFKKELEFNGIGYRASVSEDTLTLHLGYSHPINYQAPEDIQITTEKNSIKVSGIDKQKVGQVAAEIRSFKKPEPYKGKGIKYADEVIRRKAGKTGAK